MIETRPLLPMAGHTRGKRSAVTCQLKCDSACAGEVCNTTNNEYFRDIAGAAMGRRQLLGLGAAGAATLVLGGGAAQLATAPSAAASPLGSAATRWWHGSQLSFQAIKPVDRLVDELTVPAGFQWQPVIRWGDPLFKRSPGFDPLKQSAAAQAQQFGYNNDYTDIVEIPGSRGRRAIMFCNHEYVNPAIMFPPSLDAAETRAISRAAHGLSVVELRRSRAGKPWTYQQGAPLNRRFLTDTAYALTGPAAGSELLKTVTSPDGRVAFGTLGNCSGGTTPWGTMLSGEENFNGYFVTAGTSATDKRYGLTSKPTNLGWEQDEQRWDTRNPGYQNEVNHFGWIVEVDPHDPQSTPVKHTAMGRLKHEGANVIIAEDGHVVAYMGDDERFDYLYKFVSKNKYRPGNSPAARSWNKKLLSEGDLFVAKFEGDSVSEIDGSGKLPDDGRFDGSGRWIPLTRNGVSAVPGMSIAEVLVYTRLAGDKVGATKMDRCEDVQPNLRTGKIYVACTNNTNRGKAGYAAADETNPRNENRDGHVVEITERGQQISQRFDWNLLLVCGDPSKNESTYFGGFPKDKVSPISCPDNLAFDSAGDLWISTDGAPSTIGFNDGLFKVTLEGRERGRVQQFLSVPRESETCGPIVHDRDGLVFVAVQHPGEEGSWAEQRSAFPDYVKPGSKPKRGQAALPRPAVVQVFKK
ncbi:PhoX family protein [Psychromicrobium lacuslunae]|uniref:Phosphatase n=1 Tax=Psychromicrobium lacuslunae TaxID=1618207 RepID=A0A0D4BZI3_9MICC|nr:PhoX family phosphatase [Psychromicrobium lacuslunae]AJT41862.1 phosphatase [Psychromicrobium lacuslunae]